MIAFVLKSPKRGFPPVVVVDTTDIQRAMEIVRQSLQNAGEIDIYPLHQKGFVNGTRVMCSDPCLLAAAAPARPSQPMQAAPKDDVIPSTYIDDSGSHDPDVIGTPIRDPDLR